MYVVDLGDLEVIAYLKTKGSLAHGIAPEFDIDAGTNWEGDPVYLTEEDVQDVTEWVCSVYAHEVYE